MKRRFIPEIVVALLLGVSVRELWLVFCPAGEPPLWERLERRVSGVANPLEAIRAYRDRLRDRLGSGHSPTTGRRAGCHSTSPTLLRSRRRTFGSGSGSTAD